MVRCPVHVTPRTVLVNAKPGTGKKQRQIRIVEGRITDGILFPGAAIVLQERMDALLEKTKEKLKSVLNQVLEGVKADAGFALASCEEAPQHAPVPAADSEELTSIYKKVKALKARAEGVRRRAVAE
jgi:hypothetical protein